MATIKQKESEIQNSICQYLALKKYFFWRNNSTGVYDAANKRFRSIPKYAINGVPDILLIKDGLFVGIEVKRKGGIQSDSQKEFERNCKDNGGAYYLVDSIDKLIEIGL